MADTPLGWFRHAAAILKAHRKKVPRSGYERLSDDEDKTNGREICGTSIEYIEQERATWAYLVFY